MNFVLEACLIEGYYFANIGMVYLHFASLFKWNTDKEIVDYWGRMHLYKLSSYFALSFLIDTSQICLTRISGLFTPLYSSSYRWLLLKTMPWVIFSFFNLFYIGFRFYVGFRPKLHSVKLVLQNCFRIRRWVWQCLDGERRHF